MIAKTNPKMLFKARSRALSSEIDLIVSALEGMKYLQPNVTEDLDVLISKLIVAQDLLKTTQTKVTR